MVRSIQSQKPGAVIVSFPCGCCPFCKSGSVIKLSTPEDFSVDLTLWKSLVSEPDLPKDDPQLVAKFAFGFKSPIITQNKLHRSSNFGLMQGAQYRYKKLMPDDILFLTRCFQSIVEMVHFGLFVVLTICTEYLLTSNNLS